jgi:hypothetical protein
VKRVSYLVATVALVISIFLSVRIGALTLAGALAMYSIPGIRSRRQIERLIPLALIVSLITVALALPRR